MDLKSIFGRISASPTNPQPKKQIEPFDIASLYHGPATTGSEQHQSQPLDEKLRQAYFWIINHAIISPFYDIEYNSSTPQTFTFGDRQDPLTLPSSQSYCSFVLLPLLCFATRSKCLLVGGPGRGKTSSAVLMGILAGYSLQEIRRSIQKGQPQMTVSDLLGTPLPADMIKAQSVDQIGIAWRKWLGMRVKIIDEYNRIPTRTQSALLTLMADNYAELYDQTYDCPDAAWYLTANDDAGGGTYQVVEALRDRIDVVVKALHFNSRFLGELLTRVESGIKPETMVPSSIIFTANEMEALSADILKVPLQASLLRRLEFFASHLEYLETAATQFEYKTKDTVKLSTVDWNTVEALETGKDKVKDIGAQTRNGISVRAIMTILNFSKAIAYFRGSSEVTLEDFRQIIPFVLHDKLYQNPECPYFDQDRKETLRSDKISWIRNMFDMSCSEYERLRLDHHDPVAELSNRFTSGLEGLRPSEVRNRIIDIEKALRQLSGSRKFYGHMYDDALRLKYLHQRYGNYLRWLEEEGHA
jgi:MoxR-like ATPase